MKRAVALAALLLVAGCGGKEPQQAPEKNDKEIPAVVKAAPSPPAVESEFGTPVKDRVATIGLLNKRNNLTEDLVLKTGESRRVGNVIVRLATCERTLPWESPQDDGAFVQVFTEERAAANQQPQWKQVFSGWLFKNSPSLNVVEHPVYDVWVKNCAMKFPGEEEAQASASSAAKASGSGSGNRERQSSPAPKAASSATPASTESRAATSNDR